MAKENKDLEIIKQKYGEKMSQLCRELFPTFLKANNKLLYEGQLSDTPLAKFNQDKALYDVIVNNDKKEDFKNYISSFLFDDKLYVDKYNPESSESFKIDEGLSESFKKEFWRMFSYDNIMGFELPNFVTAFNAKSYRYNYCINDVYYCPDNKIIYNGEVTVFDSTKQLLIDYFVVNLSGDNKGINLHDGSTKDSFVDGLRNAKKINIERPSDKEKKEGVRWEKKIIVTLEKGDVTIELDKNNRIIGYDNPYLKRVGDNFLFYNEVLKDISLPQVEQIGKRFLCYNKVLKNLYAPHLSQKGDFFLDMHKKFGEKSAEDIRAQSVKASNPSILRLAVGIFSGLKKPEQQTEYNKEEKQ